MEFRSKSCRDEKLQIEGKVAAPKSMQDLRCYSANYVYNPNQTCNKEMKMKRAKSTSKSWSFDDAELQRKKRIAGYKLYGAEGKMKGSLRKSFKWIKNTYTQAIYGWW